MNRIDQFVWAWAMASARRDVSQLLRLIHPASLALYAGREPWLRLEVEQRFAQPFFVEGTTLFPSWDAWRVDLTRFSPAPTHVARRVDDRLRDAGLDKVWEVPIVDEGRLYGVLPTPSKHTDARKIERLLQLYAVERNRVRSRAQMLPGAVIEGILSTRSNLEPPPLQPLRDAGVETRDLLDVIRVVWADHPWPDEA